MSAPSMGACDLSVLLGHVEAYCNLGWRVLPTQGKRPKLKRWPEVATSDWCKAQDWFKSHSNIGIATGQKSGIVVLDIDPRNGGELSLKKLENELGSLPDTVTAKTGGNGLHYIFQWFDGAKSSTPVNGIDFLSNGKMFIVEPSVHPITNKPYKWLVGPQEYSPAILPDAWQALLSGSEAIPESPDAPILEGTRNQTLFDLGCQWRKSGAANERLWRQLNETNLKRCLLPLGTDEVRAIYEQCLKYEPGTQSFLTQWQLSVMSSGLSSTAKNVLWGLSSFADQDGTSCYPNREQIAARIRVSVKTVGQHLTKNSGIWFDRFPKAQESGKWSYYYVLKLPMGNNYLSNLPEV